MSITKQDLQEIMSSAWAIFRKGLLTFSQSLKQSWKAFKLKKRMLSGVVDFTFKKSKDNTIRTAKGTLKDVQDKIKGTERKNNLSIQVYFDLEKNAFRSFTKANLL